MNLACLAVRDPECPLIRRRGYAHTLDRVDPRQGRRRTAQLLDKSFDITRLARNRDSHPAAVIANPAAQPVAVRQTPDGRAESHALHQATDPDQFGKLGLERGQIHQTGSYMVLILI
jgi:hypothetical protein